MPATLRVVHPPLGNYLRPGRNDHTVIQQLLSESRLPATGLVIDPALISRQHELTRTLQMLDAIQDKLGIENDSDVELAQLEMETRPEDVLAEIKRVEEYVKAHPER